jgi:sigma-B regulation protein RsbU (phosphoserine phosphatase)
MDTKYENSSRPPSLNSAETEDIKERLRLAMKIVEQSPVILFRRMPGPEPRLVYVSENIARFGYSAEDFYKGKVQFRDLVHPEDQDRLASEIEDHANQDIGDYTQSYRIKTKSGDVRWIEDTTTTERDEEGNIVFYQGTVVDVTERILAEMKLRENEAKFRRIVETTTQGFLMTDMDLNIVDINDAFGRMLGYAREELLGKSPLDLATEEFKRFLQSDSQRLLSKESGALEGSMKAKHGRTVAVLIHGNWLLDETGQILGHVGFVTDLTEQKKSLILAGEVQKSLLPREPPKIMGFDVAGHSIPCEEIGGDYYDYLQPDRVDGDRSSILAVAVGDISGHGVDSALLMATARAVLRDCYNASENLADVIADVNRTLSEDFEATSRFMTLFALEIDRESKSLRWVRAGHDPALIYCPDRDEFFELSGPGMALGVLEELEFAENKMVGLTPGCVIALGTDGIWEASDLAGAMFGKERFKEIIKQYAPEPASVILRSVYDKVYSFTGGIKPEDDITLVIVKIQDME